MEQIYFEDLSNANAFHCYEEDYTGTSWRVEPHWHYYMEMVYVGSGQATVFINGAYHCLNAGEFIFIDSLVIHAFFGERDWNTKLIIVKFDKQLLYPANVSSESLFIRLMSVDHRLFHFGFLFTQDQTQFSGIADIFKRIIEETASCHLGCELAVRTGIGQLFLWVIRQREEDYQKMLEHSRGIQAYYKPLKQMMDYVVEHYQEPLTAEEAAKMSFMSYSYFSRKFKTVSGKTFSEYVNFIRIMEAEKKLIGTNESITEIALKVGFANTSYFIKQFQKLRFISPMQYRKKLFLNEPK